MIDDYPFEIRLVFIVHNRTGAIAYEAKRRRLAARHRAIE